MLPPMSLTWVGARSCLQFSVEGDNVCGLAALAKDEIKALVLTISLGWEQGLLLKSAAGDAITQKHNGEGDASSRLE